MQKKGIRLITIYDSYDGSEDVQCIDDPDLWTFPYDLGLDIHYSDLKATVHNLLFLCNNNTTKFSNDDWAEIKSMAYNSSRKTTTSEFIRRLNEVNPNIEVLGDYSGALNHILCKCKICGHEWDTATPAKLLSGRKCPICAIKRNRRGVIQYDADMNYIQEYESVEEAGKAVGIVSSSIVNACRGRIRTSGGFIWKYKEQSFSNIKSDKE